MRIVLLLIHYAKDTPINRLYFSVDTSDLSLQVHFIFFIYFN